MTRATSSASSAHGAMLDDPFASLAVGGGEATPHHAPASAAKYYILVCRRLLSLASWQGLLHQICLLCRPHLPNFNPSRIVPAASPCTFIRDSSQLSNCSLRHTHMPALLSLSQSNALSSTPFCRWQACHPATSSGSSRPLHFRLHQRRRRQRSGSQPLTTKDPQATLLRCGFEPGIRFRCPRIQDPHPLTVLVRGGATGLPAARLPESAALP